MNHQGYGNNMWQSNQRPTSNFNRNNVGQFHGINVNQSSSSNYSKICDLNVESNSTNLIGLIISKEGPRSFISKKGSCSERHLISFTLRDDERSFINITCWGGQEFATRLGDTFFVGNIVEIKGCQVQLKSKNPSDEKFKPWTPSPYCLNLSENHGEFNLCEEADYLSSLEHIPTRESNDFYTIEDIQANGMSLHSEHINIFALVKKIWPSKEIVTKSGKKTVKADVVLCDETTESFQLTLWDSCTNFVTNWKPLETVIFAADVRISYSDYHSAMTACTDSKTIFTIDPETPEAVSLSQFGKSQISNAVGTDLMSVQGPTKDPEISSIVNVVVIRELREMQEELAYSGQNGYGVLYGFLSHFDIDAENKSLVRNVCKVCQKKIDLSVETGCSTPNCTVIQLPAYERTPLQYNVVIGLSDASGTFDTCFVASSAVEELLDISPSEFQMSKQEVKTNLKWQHLFERVRAVIKVSGCGQGKSSKSSVRVMALQKADLSDVLDKCY